MNYEPEIMLPVGFTDETKVEAGEVFKQVDL
jgi:hypothetical protein